MASFEWNIILRHQWHLKGKFMHSIVFKTYFFFLQYQMLVSTNRKKNLSLAWISYLCRHNPLSLSNQFTFLTLAISPITKPFVAFQWRHIAVIPATRAFWHPWWSFCSWWGDWSDIFHQMLCLLLFTHSLKVLLKRIYTKETADQQRRWVHKSVLVKILR